MKRFFKLIGDIVTKTSYAIKDFHSDPIQNLAIILPAAACTISLVRSVVQYVRFLLSGGYTEQFEVSVKSGMFIADRLGSSLNDAGPIELCIGFCLAVGFILLVICYWRKVNLQKRIFMAIAISLVGISAVGLFLFNAIYNGRIPIPPAGSLERLIVDKGGSVLHVFTALLALSVLLVCILIFITESRGLLAFVFKAILLSSILIPLLFWVIENIVILVRTAIYLLIFAVVGGVGLFILVGSIASDGGGTSSAPVSKQSKSSSQPTTAKIPERRFSGNVRFYVDEGEYSILVPAGKCIFADTALDKHIYVCTLKDYKNGKFHIYLNEKRFQGI